MSAPTKEEQLEQYAVDVLQMSNRELVEYALTLIVAVESGDEEMDEASKHLHETLYNPTWFVEELFLHQAWDFPSTINWLVEVMKEAADRHGKFDT